MKNSLIRSLFPFLFFLGVDGGDGGGGGGGKGDGGDGGDGGGKGDQGDGKGKETITLSVAEFNSRLGGKQAKIDALTQEMDTLKKALSGYTEKENEAKGEYQKNLAKAKEDLTKLETELAQLRGFRETVTKQNRLEWETIAKDLTKEQLAEFGKDLENADVVTQNLADYNRMKRLGLFGGKGKPPDTDNSNGGKGKGQDGATRQERLAKSFKQ